VLLDWSLIDAGEACKRLNVKPSRGLSGLEALQRLKRCGENSLAEKEGHSAFAIFVDQFRDFMVIVLLAAAFISGLIGEYLDAIAIMIIILLNAVLGFIQEYRAERSLAALKKMTAPTAKVYREGKLIEIPAQKVVPGDIVALEAGDRICADMRLVEVNDLTINESALTGESLPVNKSVLPIKKSSSSLGDRLNMAFMGALVTGGRGRGVVVKTGKETEMGRIAHLIQESEDEETPLQKRLAQLGKILVSGCLLICALMVFLGIIQGLPPYKMFMAGVSLAVAAIPEGLPAIVTIALAIGVQRMIKRKAIVRQLPAVETLGCATVICSDKTGTLTQNKMEVQKILSASKTYTVKQGGSLLQASFFEDKGKLNLGQEKELQQILRIAVLCNNASLNKREQAIGFLAKKKKPEWGIAGDPTEGALLIAAARAGIWREKELEVRELIFEQPFSSERKMMTVVYRESKGCCAYSKGAPEVIIKRSRYILEDGKIKLLTAQRRSFLLREVEKMAAGALRNLAVAYRELSSFTAREKKDLERELIFVGVLGMLDPPRPEVFPAIERCRRAGMRVIMITGDHKITAVAIARQLKILPRDGKVITGEELEQMNERELRQHIEQCYVFARVNPEHKLRIVQALKEKGHVVAMTGDGVNDAPAVKKADIGIAMGISGTDVTKEAASLVLADDNFATIVAAVEEGRGIFENIRKFIRYLLGCNVGEILTMFLAILVGLPLPLRPIQILWVNLVTDGLPAIALGVDPVAEDIMEKPPRSPREGVFSRGLGQKILMRGIIIAVTTLFVFIRCLHQGEDLVFAQTMTFATLVITQLLFAFSCRNERKSIWQIPLLTNPYLLCAVLSSLLMMIAAIYHPFLQEIFHTHPLNVEHWTMILFISFIPYFFSFFLFLQGKLFRQKIFREVQNKHRRIW
jgi:Ca2+-transporting ATPase